EHDRILVGAKPRMVVSLGNDELAESGRRRRALPQSRPGTPRAVHRLAERVPLEGRGTGRVGVVEEGRGNVDERHDLADPLARVLSREAHDEWHPDELVVERSAMPEAVVVTELLAMVRGDDDERVPEEVP